ncbi:MAG: hypothetical protein FWE36_05335 [Erysipelotrichales bacterium]|nr:hypothetical protein [Erysipelotrichales bacterium]
MEKIIARQKKRYPLMEKQDLLKLLLQSQSAGGHMISNKESALAYLKKETETISGDNLYLYEEISDKFVRLNLKPYKKYNFCLDYLNDVFVQTANDTVIKDIYYQGEKIGLNHHSEIYRNNYFPAYRVIDKSFITEEMRYIQVLNFLELMKKVNNKVTIVALEGRCASGKTWLSEKLTDYTILHIDDFFLPEEKKLKEFGGNVNYEAVKSVLTKLKANEKMVYQKYNCTTNTYQEAVLIPGNCLILEGVYSYHPNIRNLIDYLIFLDTEADIRSARLEKRILYERYINEWIPQEEQYFETFDIKYLSDLIV